MKINNHELGSENAEKGLLGCFLLSPIGTRDECNAWGVTSDSFLNPVNGNIFTHLCTMMDEGKPIDLIAVTQELEDRGYMEECGGAAYITELFTFVPTAANRGYYIEVLQSKYAARVAYKECHQIAAEVIGMNSIAQVQEKLSKAFVEPLEICHPVSVNDENIRLAMEYIDELESHLQGKTKFDIRSTPFPTLNTRNGGTCPGEITGIVGPTSSGKSLLGKQFVQNLCMEHGLGSAIFTGEMPYKQVVNRIICDIGNVNLQNLRTGKLLKHEFSNLSEAFRKFKDAPMNIYDQKRIRFTDAAIESEIRKLSKHGGLKVVLVDMLQHITYTRKKGLRTDEEIGRISMMLKNVAIEFGLHIFVICKANEEGGVRNSGEPQYDFDNILNLNVRVEKGPNPKIFTENIVVSKWREGPRGYAIQVEMDGPHCRFNDTTPQKSF